MWWNSQLCSFTICLLWIFISVGNFDKENRKDRGEESCKVSCYQRHESTLARHTVHLKYFDSGASDTCRKVQNVAKAWLFWRDQNKVLVTERRAAMAVVVWRKVTLPFLPIVSGPPCVANFLRVRVITCRADERRAHRDAQRRVSACWQLPPRVIQVFRLSLRYLIELSSRHLIYVSFASLIASVSASDCPGWRRSQDAGPRSQDGGVLGCTNILRCAKSLITRDISDFNGHLTDLVRITRYPSRNLEQKSSMSLASVYLIVPLIMLLGELHSKFASLHFLLFLVIVPNLNFSFYWCTALLDT